MTPIVKRELIIWPSVFAAVALLIYLMAAFASWTFNPGDWHEKVRAVSVVVWFIISLFVATGRVWRM